MKAHKRWGHGRLRQLAAGVICWFAGHPMSAGWIDGKLRIRTCQRGCGHLTTERLVSLVYPMGSREDPWRGLRDTPVD